MKKLFKTLFIIPIVMLFFNLVAYADVTNSSFKIEQNSKITLDKKEVVKSVPGHFICDYSYSKETNSLYYVSIIFKTRNVNFDDTAEYHDMKVNVGRPYTFVYKVDLDTLEKDLLYKKVNPSVWIRPYNNKFDESKVHLKDDSLYSEKVLFNYADYVVNTKLCISKYDSSCLYMITGRPGTEGNLNYEECKGVNLIIFNVNDKTYTHVSIPYTEFTNIAKEDRGTHFIDPRYFFVKEESKDLVNIYSLGTEKSSLSTAMQFDLSNNGAYQTNVYSATRTKLMKLVKQK